MTHLTLTHVRGAGTPARGNALALLIATAGIGCGLGLRMAQRGRSARQGELTMAGVTAVLACALTLLGRSVASMPPITLVESPPPPISANAEAFVWSGEARIYVIASAPAYRDARCRSRLSLVKLASVLVHEEWHVRHGGDESAAYNAQLRALLELGAKVDSPVYRGVVRAMRSVEAANRRGAVNVPQPVARLDPLVFSIDQEIEAPWLVSPGR